MSGMTIKQALAVIQTEVNWHASSDTHYRAERLEQSLATLRAEIDGLRRDNEALREVMLRVAKYPSGSVILARIGVEEARRVRELVEQCCTAMKEQQP